MLNGSVCELNAAYAFLINKIISGFYPNLAIYYLLPCMVPHELLLVKIASITKCLI